MKRLLLAAALCVAMGPVVSGPKRHLPCYGNAEREIALIMLEYIPYLRKSLMEHEQDARRIRLVTCLRIEKTGRVGDGTYADAFFEDSRNRAIKEVAKARGVNRQKLLSAIVDMIWPPMSI